MTARGLRCGVALVVVFQGCGYQPPPAYPVGPPPARASTPCSDTTYVRLRAASLDSLSLREYELFRTRDQACLTHQANAPRDSILMRAATTYQQSSDRLWGYLLFSAVLGTLVYFLATGTVTTP